MELSQEEQNSLKEALSSNPIVRQINKNICWFIEVVGFLTNALKLDDVMKDQFIEAIADSIKEGLKEYKDR